MSGHIVAYGQFGWSDLRRAPVMLWCQMSAFSLSPRVAKIVRVAAGSVMGLLFAAACGNLAFWLAAGTAIGWILARVSAQAE